MPAMRIAETNIIYLALWYEHVAHVREGVLVKLWKKIASTNQPILTLHCLRTLRIYERFANTQNAL